MSRKLIVVLACLLSLSLAAPALAFNPQPDPPAGHARGGF